MIADRWGSPGRTTELAQAVLCWASSGWAGAVRVEAGLSNQYTAAAMVLVICGRVVSVSTRAELTNSA